MRQPLNPLQSSVSYQPKPSFKQKPPLANKAMASCLDQMALEISRLKEARTKAAFDMRLDSFRKEYRTFLSLYNL